MFLVVRNIMESIPMKRMATPDEIGKLVAFLCSPDSSYITGTNIQIDGGGVYFHWKLSPVMYYENAFV